METVINHQRKSWRRGVVKGIDFGATGEVQKVDVKRMRERLDARSIVLLSNLGHSSSGEVLNCNVYEVATACALALGAEKLICIIDGPILDELGHLIRFLTIHDAEILFPGRATQSEIAANYVEAIDEEDCKSQELGLFNGAGSSMMNGRSSATFQNGFGFDNSNGLRVSSMTKGFARQRTWTRKRPRIMEKDIRLNSK